MMLSLFISFLLLFSAIAGQSSQSTNRHPLNGVSTRQRRIHRTLQSWAIRHRSKPNVRTSAPTKMIDGMGSVVTVFRPTKERIAKWFGLEEDPDQLLRCMLRKEFNHDSVGMTNPFLHFENDQNGEDPLLLSVQNDNLQITVPASTNDSATANTWWPSLSFSPIRKKEWRVLTHRRRVGQGRGCYERVRDAALDWEFQSPDGLLGMLAIPSSSFLQHATKQRSTPNLRYRGSYSVRSIPTGNVDEPMAFHRRIGSFRRMVSYSASKLPLLRKIYVVNPVMVVYDLVDQRAPDTTFTSTAYATMKGHLLRGEERVTVALRDRSEAVDVEIVSISKAGNSFKAKGIWPFIGNMQRDFFNNQMDALQEVAEKCSNSQAMPTNELLPRIHIGGQ